MPPKSKKKSIAAGGTIARPTEIEAGEDAELAKEMANVVAEFVQGLQGKEKQQFLRHQQVALGLARPLRLKPAEKEKKSPKLARKAPLTTTAKVASNKKSKVKPPRKPSGRLFDANESDSDSD